MSERKIPAPSKKQVIGWSSKLAALGVFVFFVVVITLTGHNELHNWQVIQYPWGKLEIRDKRGWYMKYGARVSTYPRAIDVLAKRSIPLGEDGKPLNVPEFDEVREVLDDGTTITTLKVHKGARQAWLDSQGESVLVQFNDGGEALISWFARVTTPVSEEVRHDFHKQMTGDINKARSALRSFIRNCLTQTGPIMSASENQSARKAELWQAVHDQIMTGLWATKRVELKQNMGIEKMLEQTQQGEIVDGELADAMTELPIETTQTVVAAEILYDEEGNPVVASPSPLHKYGMKLLQFSITETEYDPSTKVQFSMKKHRYLEAERSIAAKIQNVQSRFLRVARGDREVAQSEWLARKDQTRDKIRAELKEEVALVDKERLSIDAETRVLEKEQVRLEEDLRRQIADVKAQAAEVDRQAAQIAAEAREQELELAGAVSEHEQELLGISVKRTEGIVKPLAKFKVPEIMFIDPDAFDPAEGSLLEQALPNFRLLKAFGLLDGQQRMDITPRREAVVEVRPPAVSTAAVVK